MMKKELFTVAERIAALLPDTDDEDTKLIAAFLLGLDLRQVRRLAVMKGGDDNG